MLAFPGMIAKSAAQAGMKVPENPDEYFDREEFPHFHVFCLLQLGRPMLNLAEHWDNAKVIAPIPEDELKKMKLMDFLAKGLQYTT